MLFNSPIFLFLFLPLVLLVNPLLRTKASNYFLLLASLAFYFYGERWVTLLLIVSIVWNYAFGLLVEEQNNYRKLSLTVNVIGNLALLIYFKYSFFIAENLQLEQSFNGLENIVLPLGISFFTFQGLSYVTDVYRKEVKAERSIINVGFYISYFPQLIAGPIIKYKEIHSYITERKASQRDIYEGIIRFIRGLTKKVILADNFSLVADEIFTQAPSELTTPVAWLGVLAYTLQIYFDFSAYSDMAIALGRMMGLKIPENFNYPYIASSIRGFWRRWHISLSTWFRDYLYIPLGGSRKSNGKTYFNLIIVFFITGLWHGANWNFVIWGGIHGLFLILERINHKRIPTFIGRAYTLFVVALSWVVFRNESLTNAIAYYKKLFVYDSSGYNEVLLLLNPYFIFLFIIGIVAATPIRLLIQKRLNVFFAAQQKSYSIINASFMLALFIYALSEVISSNHHPFIYFKF